jgi:hypothetical protein
MARERVCHGCTVETGRSPTCHQTCEKYLAERAEDARMKELDEIERGALAYECERRDRRRAGRAMATIKRNRFKNRT